MGIVSHQATGKEPAYSKVKNFETELNEAETLNRISQVNCHVAASAIDKRGLLPRSWLQRCKSQTIRHHFDLSFKSDDCSSHFPQGLEGRFDELKQLILCRWIIGEEVPIMYPAALLRSLLHLLMTQMLLAR